MSNYLIIRMSINKFGYSAEGLQKDKIENLEKELNHKPKYST